MLDSLLTARGISRISLLAALAGALTGCGDISNTKGKVKSVFVHGDPMAILAGSTGIVSSIFPTAETTAFADFSLFGGAYFHERSPAGTATTSEEGNEAATGEAEAALDRYEFVQDGDGFIYRSPASVGAPELVFADQDGALALTGVRLDGKTDTPVEPIHYSITPEKDAFSLLFKTTDPDDGSGIIAVYFTKNHPAQDQPRVSTEYKYLLGPGITAGWEDGIKINLCGALTADDAAQIRKGIEAWSTAGSIGKQKLVVGTSATYPPFSDVNARCVQLVDGFYFEDQEDYAVYGITIPAIDRTREKILASSIVISQAAFAKTPGLDEAKRSILLAYVASHEFGHFIGLDHEFTKNDDGTPKYQSIMSYEFDDIADSSPRQHDREAIDLLYQ
jgi:hypothetical protein